MFTKKREKYISNLKVLFQEFEHPCGTKHYHLKSENTENCFVISFPTLPENNDGRAHILEHLVLCGSEKFETHDPFFAMTRRSLATFMNAMTYSDKTAYPFATTDKKDYFNLLSVYLDATFFPKLDYHNFLQEGWRYEIKADGSLGYTGVVYNEMKGALSDKYHHVYFGIEKNLKKDTSYCFESGGDPIEIPKLRHDDLMEFHSTHYHPSRATIMTFGDIPPEEVQDFFEKEVISKIKTKQNRIKPKLSSLKLGKHDVTEEFPVDNKADEKTENMLILNWLLGESDSAIVDDFQIFSHILTSEGGFLCSSLEDSGFGRPSEFVGVFNHNAEASFHLGFEGLTNKEISVAKKYIIDKITYISEYGVSMEAINASLDDIESEIKNISSGRMPYGLSLLLNGLAYASRDKDPLSGIDHEEALKKIRERFSDSDYIKVLAKKLLSDIPLVSIKFKPNASFFEERNSNEEKRLNDIKKSLTKKEISEIVKSNAMLLEKQKNEHSYECLPKIKPSDVSLNVRKDFPIQIIEKNKKPTVGYLNLATNGISYVNSVFDISNLKQEDWKWVQLLTVLMPGMPSIKESWQVAMANRSILCKNIDISIASLNDIDNIHAGKVLFEINCFHLEEKAENIINIFNEFFFNISFRDWKRVVQIIEQEISDFEQNVSTLGNMLASQEAKYNLNFMGKFQKETTGLHYVNFLKESLASFREEESRERFFNKLTKLYKNILSQDVVFFAAGSEKTLSLLKNIQDKFNFNGCHKASVKSISIENKNSSIKNIAIVSPTEVNYCHMVFPVKKITHENKDSVYLDLAAQLMTHNFLHPRLREQGGAYGANASFNVFNGVFSFSTYRDPGFLETYNEFNNVINWFKKTRFTEEQLNEAKISLLQNLDKPTTPKTEFENSVSIFFMGIKEATRKARKEAIINAKIDDIVKMVTSFLCEEMQTSCAFISPSIANLNNHNFELTYIN